MKTIKIILSILVALTATGTAVAQTTNAQQKHWFSVEVIVFRPTSSAAGSHEYWPADPTLPSLTDAIVPTAQNAIRPLPASQYKLQGVWDQLEQSGRYEPLVHTGWIQQGEPSSQSPLVSITQTVPAPVQQIVPVFSDAAPTPAPTKKQIAPLSARAFGTVKLSYDRYLTLALDMAYRPANPADLKTWHSPGKAVDVLPTATTTATPVPTTPAQTNVPTQDKTLMQKGPKAIVMKESRRIKPEQLNYFDNPLFGVIVQVLPIKTDSASK